MNVPQVYASQLNTGAKATISVPDQPGKQYSATVEASARSVNVATGTTLMQLSVDNKAGELLPGGYASVSFELAADAQALRVPASALIFDQSGLRVATVGADNRVVMKPITIARDHGTFIEVASGIEATDRVIATPPDGLIAGSAVRVLEPAVKEADARARKANSGNAPVELSHSRGAGVGGLLARAQARAAGSPGRRVLQRARALDASGAGRSFAARWLVATVSATKS